MALLREWWSEAEHKLAECITGQRTCMSSYKVVMLPLGPVILMRLKGGDVAFRVSYSYQFDSRGDFLFSRRAKPLRLTQLGKSLEVYD